MSRKTIYSQPDGEGMFQAPDELFAQSGVADFIIEYGQQGLDALDAHPDEQIQQLIDQMLQVGLLERDAEGKLRITPRMVRGVQDRALIEIYAGLKTGTRGDHEALGRGSLGESTGETRAYTFGDPLNDIDAAQSLRNAIRRSAQQDLPALPIQLQDGDLEIATRDTQADTALVVLIDLSGSMMRYDRHIAAKKVALGLEALVRSKFPQDTVEFIGFGSTAKRLAPSEIPLVMPFPITTREWEVEVKIPLEDADKTHPHFTNLHHALRLARASLRRSGAANKQVFLITDGQPTAHLTEYPNGTMLNLLYPPAKISSDLTLTEAHRAATEGIRFSTFALIEEYYTMDWVGFVDQLTRLTRGTAFYCTAGDLAGTIVESFLNGKRTKRTMG